MGGACAGAVKGVKEKTRGRIGKRYVELGGPGRVKDGDCCSRVNENGSSGR